MKKIGFIGAGNMAGALIKGLLRSRRYRPQDLWASDPVATQLRRLKRKFRVAGCRDNRELVRGSQVVILAVKPQILDQVLREVRDDATADKLFISIAAGVPLRRLESGLGDRARVIRVMPNTPALVGKGMAVMVRGKRATARDERLALTLFRGVGEALAVKGEEFLDAVTGLSGSGPAYVYLFAEALVAGGSRVGLPPSVAQQLAYQTLEGAVAMLRETGKGPQELRDMVTSPGGTTLAGLRRLEEGRFVETIAGAIAAATLRSKELGRG